MKNPEPGLYKHYKGNVYELLAIARHSETLEKMAVYKATYRKEGDNIWVRPLAMFTEALVIDGKTVNRFTKL